MKRIVSPMLLLLAAMALAACMWTVNQADGVPPPAQASAPLTLTYPIVDTGQETCYDSGGAVIDCPAAAAAFTGQDAQNNGNQPNFQDNGDGTTTDLVTGVMWQRSADSNRDGDILATDKFTYSAAESYCADLTLAGYDDWRLPNIKTLYSLIDFRGLDPSGYNGTNTSQPTPFLDTDYFDFAYGDTTAGERIIDAQYASSTMYVSSRYGALLFGVNFADGRIKGYGLNAPGGEKTFFVICARGSEDYGVNQFVDNGDDTITDSATGLMWAQDDSGVGMDWAEALLWVQQKNAENYLGYNDWRLPNVKELQSLLDYSRSPDTTNSAAIDPLFNVTPITNEVGETDYAYYWSGTTHASWTTIPEASGPGWYASYVSFGRALGYMNNNWVDVHGAGAQRSDPKVGDASAWPTGHGPQGDAIRIDNYVRLVRDADNKPTVDTSTLHLPVVMR